MMHDLTQLEIGILKEIIRPSITTDFRPSGDHLQFSRSDTLNFRTLILNIREFYKGNGGANWDEVIKGL